MAQLLLTLIGEDREGLVEALSSVVEGHGGNWLESQLAHLGGQFAGIVLVDIPDEKAQSFSEAAREMPELHVSVHPAGADDEIDEGTPMTLHLLGNDRPGIVHQVSAALAAQRVTIDEMYTSTRPAPMADTVLFEAMAEVRLPEGVDPDEVRDALEAIAAELMVDLDLDASVDEDNLEELDGDDIKGFGEPGIKEFGEAEA